jgi:hypothetical protein
MGVLPCYWWNFINGVMIVFFLIKIKKLTTPTINVVGGPVILRKLEEVRL